VCASHALDAAATTSPSLDGWSIENWDLSDIRADNRHLTDF
jgi:hypothetical protein